MNTNILPEDPKEIQRLNRISFEKPSNYSYGHDVIAITKNLLAWSHYCVQNFELTQGTDGRFKCHCGDFKNKGYCDHSQALELQREEIAEAFGVKL